jgi:DNA-binding NtrC family response regulator
MTSQNIIRESVLREECESVKQSLKKKFGLSHILGRSKAVQELCQKVDKMSLYKVNVLISGESGTGKELAARAIHYLSRRAGKPFIPINCGAIPESIFENELFGHFKGAFTDAGLTQIGLVKQAEGGTLFLDEISAVSLYNQVKLLRLIQDKEYKPLGQAKPQKADIRIIAATNKNLKQLVKEGGFREDLFYRINVVSLCIPPLRRRKEDIPILVEYFMSKYCKEYNKPIRVLSKETMTKFMSYSWPGNIRELENKIQQIIVMSTTPVINIEVIEPTLGEPISKENRLEDFNAAKKKMISSFERTYLTQLLTEHCGNVVKAAEKAGKSRTGLWNLLKKYNISPTKFRYYHNSKTVDLE